MAQSSIGLVLESEIIRFGRATAPEIVRLTVLVLLTAGLMMAAPSAVPAQVNIDEIPYGLELPPTEATKVLTETEVAAGLAQRHVQIRDRCQQRLSQRLAEGARTYDAPRWSDIEPTLSDELRATLADEEVQ